MVIPSHSSRSVPLRVTFPDAPGDHPESVQFTADGPGSTAVASVPVARRTLIPSQGGSFEDLLTSTVGRQLGQLDTYKIDVPSGLSQLTVTFHASDASADNGITYFLVGPDGTLAGRTTTPNTTGSDPGTTTLTATAPAAGVWEIDVELGLTMSGTRVHRDGRRHSHRGNRLTGKPRRIAGGAPRARTRARSPTSR